MKTQAVIVSKNIARGKRDAILIASKFGKTGMLRETVSSFRFRQAPPSQFGPRTFRTKKLDGVTLVLGKKK